MDLFSNQIKELYNIISKIPIRVFCVTVLPEFGMKWRDVARAVRNARLGMTPPNVARVICKHIARSMPDEDIGDIVARLSLKFIATQNRMWYVITLSEQRVSEPVQQSIELLRKRTIQALKQGKTGLMTPVLHSVILDNLMFISIQLVSSDKEGPTLYAVTPPGEPVLLVSSLKSTKLIQALVEGLGYTSYEDAKLHDRDIISLLRIHNNLYNEYADNLDGVPEYAPLPVATPNGIDYTNRQYDENYIDNILGPDPPLLTELNVQAMKPFHDRSIMDKNITLKIQVKSDDIAMTLRTWVRNGALAPNCEFLRIFDKIKSNDVIYNKDDSD